MGKNEYWLTDSTDDWTEELQETMLELKDSLDLPTEEVERTLVSRFANEKRKAHRYEIDVPISVNSENRIIESWIGDLNYSGCFIKTDAPYEVGEKIYLNLTTQMSGASNLKHGSITSSPIKAVVRWCRTNQNMSLEYEGMGVEFIDLTESQKQDIKTILRVSETETYIS